MSKVRSNTEIVPNLPTYEAKIYGNSVGLLEVTCPREDCGGHFIVGLSRWYKHRKYMSNGREHVIKTRSCPYCMRTAHLPPRPKQGS